MQGAAPAALSGAGVCRVGCMGIGGKGLLKRQQVVERKGSCLLRIQVWGWLWKVPYQQQLQHGQNAGGEGYKVLV